MEAGHQLRGDRKEELDIQRLSEADLVLLVTDILDFEGSFSRRLALRCGSRLIVVANKVDLLPSRSRSDVSAWLTKRLEEEHIAHIGVAVVSALEGTGIVALWEMIRREINSPDDTVAIVGADRVGKSTLLQALSSAGERRSGSKKRAARRSGRRRKKAVARHV
ncbi:MAG: hypothetical protein GX162_05385 [Firmicutes bacterium]|jgi:ribosome biogenesis GTPase A|nr:hypothetical protein [Bacillota bacterium]